MMVGGSSSSLSCLLTRVAKDQLRPHRAGVLRQRTLKCSNLSQAVTSFLLTTSSRIVAGFIPACSLEALGIHFNTLTGGMGLRGGCGE